MPEMEERELIALVNAEFDTAMGGGEGEIAAERAKAYNYYLSKLLGNEVEGSSRVVTSDVADAVDGMMPSLLRMFTISENLVSFEPHGQEDEEAASQESDYVNHVFFKKNPAFILMFSWMFDALLQKNGFVKSWWDESETVTTETYEGLTEDELLQLMNDEELEAVERSEREGDIVQTVAPEVAPEAGGAPVQTVVRGIVHDIKFRRVRKRGQVRVDNVPPEEFRISSDARSIDPSATRMVGQEREVTRSELIDMGFSKGIVERLPAVGAPIANSEEEIARRDKTDEDQGGAHDTSQEKVPLREAYVLVDFDGDGRSELRQVFLSGSEMLGNEESDRQPFHVICPYLLPHKHFGRSVADKTMDVQEVTTTLLRQTLNNTYHSNQPGHAVWEQGLSEHTMDDLLTVRIGRVVRFARPVGEAYTPMTVPFTAGNTFAMLEFFDRIARERTGVSADTEGLTPEALKNIQTTVMAQATDLSKMKVEAVARVFAETGFKSLFLHIHELLLKHQQKGEKVKLRNKWVEVNPAEWKERKDMTVNIGLGIGTREQNLIHLSAIGDIQRQMVEAGGLGTLVTLKNLFNTAEQVVKNANFKTPDMFFNDPGDAQPTKGTDPAEQALQIQAQLESQRMELEVAKHQLAIEKLEFQQAEAGAKHLRELEKLRLDKEEIENKLTVEMEKIRNDITRLDLQTPRELEGSRVS